MKLKAITVIDDGKTKIAPDEIFSRAKKEAENLIEIGAAVLAAKVAPAASAPDEAGLSNPTTGEVSDLDLSEEAPDTEPDSAPRDPLTGLPTS